jgi:hypothetical protein
MSFFSLDILLVAVLFLSRWHRSFSMPFSGSVSWAGAPGDLGAAVALDQAISYWPCRSSQNYGRLPK